MKKWILNAGICIMLSGCAQTLDLKKQTFTIELGQDVYANPNLYMKEDRLVDQKRLKVVPVTNGIAIKDNRFISVGKDILEVGEYDFKLDYDGDATPFVIKIKDTQPPTLTNTPSSIEVGYLEKIDWDSVFQASDLSGVTYESANDLTSTSGEKDTVVKIKDRYGNTIEQPIKVVVR
ncbi:hypothetical protein [Dubosiella newyorkensis]|jgi:hypothetical protein|nr:hypothetical protein [Dubosiella newyorkensis]MCI9040343.1 hypothetical protein [Dubosiella newyorkensis]